MNIFEEDAKEISRLENLNGNSIASLSECVELYLQLNKDIEWLESALKNKKADLNKLETGTLPEMMLLMNCKEHSTLSGEIISLQDIISVSIPSLSAIEKLRGDERQALMNRRESAFRWLRENNLDGIVKNEINIDVGKSKEQKESIINALKNIGVCGDVVENVHPMTLNATFKELLKSGENIPDDIFNVYMGKKVKITKK